MGFNLCPFAKPSFVKGQIRIEVAHGENPTDILAHVVEECWKLQGDNKEGTTLVLCPDLFPDDFEEFLAILNVLEEGILEDLNLSDELQIAPFHPLFVFGDADDDGDGNEDAIGSYTNRAPYPIFHILREEEVSKAVEALEGDAAKVWKRNIALLQSLDDEFSETSEDTESEADLLRHTVLKGKLNEQVNDQAARYCLQKRVQRAMNKFKRERLA
ncbi:MAG: hypothetical protein SGARI_008279 [Bacillariaceae sp.]